MSGSVKERGVSWETWAQRKQNEGSSSALPSEVRIQAVQLDTLIRIADTLDRMLAVMLDEGDEPDAADPGATLDDPSDPRDLSLPFGETSGTDSMPWDEDEHPVL